MTPTPRRRVRRRPPAAQTKDRAAGAPPLTAQIVGPLVQHPLHGAGRGPSLAALTAPGPPRRAALAAGLSPGAAEPPTPGARPTAGTPGRSHRRPGAGSLQRPRHVRAGQGLARLRSGAGTGMGRRGGRASKVPQARQRVAGGADTPRFPSPRPAGPGSSRACSVHSWRAGSENPLRVLAVTTGAGLPEPARPAGKWSPGRRAGEEVLGAKGSGAGTAGTGVRCARCEWCPG